MKRMYVVLSIFLGIVLIFGSSYAFFLFRKTGGTSVLGGGSFYVDFTEGSELSFSLSNVFPMASFNARKDDSNTLTFHVTGENDTDGIINYSIVVNNGTDVPAKTRFNASSLRFDLIRIENGEDIYVVRNKKFDVLSNSVLYTRTLTSDDGIINEEYKIRVWLSDDVIISDTMEGNDVYTTTDYANRYANIKVGLLAANNKLGEKKKNYMNEFPSFVTTNSANVVEIYFNELTSRDLTEYESATLKETVTYQSQGSVKFWFTDVSESQTPEYILHVGSNGLTYLIDGEELFTSFTNATKIIFNNVDTSKVTSMKKMFYGCEALETLNLSSFNTKNVTTMDSMFSGCTDLERIDLRGFDTSNVTNMSNMFNSCESLLELKLNDFSTSKVTTMESMFKNVSGLTTLDLSMMDVSNVTTMAQMFYGIDTLPTINFSGWNIANLDDAHEMFANATGFTVLDLSTFDTSALLDFTNMFYNCSSLQTIYVSMSWDTRSLSATGTDNTFYNTLALVGGQGTSYSSSHVTIDYARIDNPATEPGYFTYKEVL